MAMLSDGISRFDDDSRQTCRTGDSQRHYPGLEFRLQAMLHASCDAQIEALVPTETTEIK
jgi:hypothetical protein